MNSFKKQKKTKKHKKYKKLIILKISSIIVIIFFSFWISSTILNVMDLNKQLQLKRKELANMQHEKDLCINELKLLDSNEYMDQILRDDYFYLKDDELFFLITELNKENAKTERN